MALPATTFPNKIMNYKSTLLYSLALATMTFIGCNKEQKNENYHPYTDAKSFYFWKDNINKVFEAEKQKADTSMISFPDTAVKTDTVHISPTKIQKDSLIKQLSFSHYVGRDTLSQDTDKAIWGYYVVPAYVKNPKGKYSLIDKRIATVTVNFTENAQDGLDTSRVLTRTDRIHFYDQGKKAFYFKHTTDYDPADKQRLKSKNDTWTSGIW